MNNQAAVLKVAQNQVYFRLNYDKQSLYNVQRDSINVSSDIQTVPIGLVMSVQPSIDQSSGDVTLFLRPTISRLSQSVRDPAVDIAMNASGEGKTSSATTPGSLIPVVEVREIDSVLRVHPGDIAILGGLMEVRSYNDTSKLPLLGDIPLAGDLFKSHAEGDRIVELVILLKVTHLDSGFHHAADQRLQQTISDPRPF
jgi:general secretion pathway protein D